MAGDASFDLVGMLLHGDGANASTVFTDSGPLKRTVTATAAVISTAQSKFGGASMLFNGTSALVATPMDANLQLAANDFTFECWVYLAGTPAANYTIGSCFNSDNTGYRFMIDSTRKFVGLSAIYVATTTITTNLAASAVIALNTWTHVAWVRSGNRFYSFVNGVLDQDYTISGSGNGSIVPSTAVNFEIGRNVGSTWYFNGYIDDWRLTKGVARYGAAGFAPPTAPFLDYGGQISGTVKVSGAGVVRTVRAYRRDTGALVGSAASDASGNYTINATTATECTVICLDDAAGTVENDLVLRAVPA